MFRKYYNSLDLLKFLAAVWLMLGHYQQVMGVLFKYTQVRLEIGLLNNVVELFFLISGFLFAPSLKTIGDDAFSVFFKKKACRLYPMVIITVVVGWVVLYIQYALTGDETISLGFWNLLNSCLLTFNGGVITNIEYGINNPTWYICVLLICYTLGYFISYISKITDTNTMNYVVGMVFIGLGILNYNIDLPFANYYSARGYEAFFLGIIIFTIYDSAKNKLLITLGAAFTIAVIVYCMFQHAIMIDDVEAINIFILNPAILLFFLGINNCFKTRLWYFLGGISFEIYIWHAVILVIFTCYMHLTADTRMLSWVGALIFAAVTTIVSLLSYVCVEPKVNALMKKFLCV